MSDPMQLLSLYQKAVEFAEAGNFQNAIENFSECIAIDDKNPMIFILRSTAYCQLKEYSKALLDVHVALSLDQSISSAYSTKAFIEWSMGDFKSALSDYDKAISLGSKYSADFMNRGQVKRDAGDLDGAIEDLQKASELDPSNSTARQIMDFCQKMKRNPKAYEKFLAKKRL